MNIAIVTGASSGMGREFVLQLSNYVEVDEIWVIARREEALQKLSQEIPVPVRAVPLDLCLKKSF
jgi:NADP-dependent 3-hydroxy acid dehydrogenase YdfG